MNGRLYFQVGPNAEMGALLIVSQIGLEYLLGLVLEVGLSLKVPCVGPEQLIGLSLDLEELGLDRVG